MINRNNNIYTLMKINDFLMVDYHFPSAPLSAVAGFIFLIKVLFYHKGHRVR